MVNSYEEAKEAVDFTFYPPDGNRGVGLHRAQGYGSEFDKYYNKKSKEIELIVQIEHYKAIEDLEKLLISVKYQNLYRSFRFIELSWKAW